MRRFASPKLAVLAGLLGAVSLASIPVLFALEALIHQLSASSSNAAATLAGIALVVAFTVVGVLVARRQPRNPMGWLLIALVLAVNGGSVFGTYAYLDYGLHGGRLPLGPPAVLLSNSWSYAFALMPLIVLLFPDGRLGRRWRWPLRIYAAIIALFTIGMVGLVVHALGAREPVDASGNLAGTGTVKAWFASLQTLGYAACFTMLIAAIVHQVRSYRSADGERREQLKWMSAGATVLGVCLVINAASGSGSGVIGQLTFSVGLAALPLGMGVGILKYRLYEIDRIISRTLSYGVVTALLAGTFVGLVLLSTRVLPFSSTVAVAASTLAAAALFNPLRTRVQRGVDRRFNRARYDAEAMVEAFAARLRDAVDLDTVQDELITVVSRAVEPAHASVWMRGSRR